MSLHSLLEVSLNLRVYFQSLVDLVDSLSCEGEFVLLAVVVDVLEVADELPACPGGDGGRGGFSEGVW